MSDSAACTERPAGAGAQGGMDAPSTPGVGDVPRERTREDGMREVLGKIIRRHPEFTADPSQLVRIMTEEPERFRALMKESGCEDAHAVSAFYPGENAVMDTQGVPGVPDSEEDIVGMGGAREIVEKIYRRHPEFRADPSLLTKLSAEDPEAFRALMKESVREDAEKTSGRA